MRRILVALALLVVAVSPSLQPSAAALSVDSLVGQVRDWPYTDWGFRKPIRLVDQYNLSRANVPVFLALDVPPGHAFSMTRELLVVDSFGRRVPFVVVHESADGLFSRRAYILLFADFTLSNSTTYRAYYGNPSASSAAAWGNLQAITDRRSRAVVAFSVGKGDLRAEVAPTVSRDHGVIRVFYREDFRLNLLAKLGVDAGDYGAPAIARSPFYPSVSWRRTETLPGLEVISSAYEAGGVLLLRVAVIGGERIWFFDTVVNEGSEPVPQLSFLDAVDTRPLLPAGLVTGFYRSEEATMITSVAGALFGYRTGEEPIAYEVARAETSLASARSLDLRGTIEEAGDLLLLMKWSPGPLGAGEHFILPRYFSVSAQIENLTLALQNMEMPRYEILAEESLLKLPTRAVSLFTQTLAVENQTVARGGSSLNLAAGGLQVVGRLSQFSGNVTYGLPSPPTGFNPSWEIESAVFPRREPVRTFAFVSAHQYSVEKQKDVAHIAIDDAEVGPYAQASLSSPVATAVGVSAAVLKIGYRALARSSASDLNGTLAYVRVLFDWNLDEVYDGSLLLPVNGTAPGGGELVAVLENDGQWRNLEVDVTPQLASPTFQFRVVVYAQSDSRSTGGVEFQVDQLFLELRGRAEDALRAAVDGGSLMLTYELPGLNQNPLFSDLDATLSVPAFRVHRLSGYADGVFRFRLDVPQNAPPPLQNVTSPATGVPLAGNYSVTRSDPMVLVYTGYADLVNRVLLNDRSIAEACYSSVLGAVGVCAEAEAPLASLDLVIGMVRNRFLVRVLDGGGAPLEGAEVRVFEAFGNSLMKEATGRDGVVAAYVVPTVYVVRTFYHGAELFAKTVRVEGDYEESYPVRVFLTTIRVVDRLEQPVGEARVQISRGVTTVFDGYTDRSGLISLRVVGWTPYRARVSLESVTFPEHVVQATSYSQGLRIPVDHLRVTSESVGILLAVVFAVLVPTSVLAGGVWTRRR